MHPNDTTKLCECGCGRAVTQTKNPKRQRRFISGHNIKPIYATIEDRFWADCVKHEQDACWEWKGNSERHGYGLMNFRHKDYLAHRISYQIHHGPIPEGLLVCHECDNPPCTNPGHLFLGTPAINSADMVNKGRHRKVKPRPKVTPEQVIEIRSTYAAGGISQYEIAKIYKVSRSTIKSIVERRSWKDIP